MLSGPSSRDIIGGKEMAEFKIVINDPKSGKSKQIEAKEDQAKPFLDLKIGDNVKGEVIDMQGYEFELRGGSDHCGFPMRKGINLNRKKILTKGGVGFKNFEKGLRKRKTVCGEKVHENIKQLNLKVIKYGATPLFEEKPVEAEEKKDGE
tara:strand:- start:809 stop:1258 length:450 start_codon:yes stop_codon:yes gene_type:complete